MLSSSPERVLTGDDSSPTTRRSELRPRGLAGVRNDLADIGEYFTKAVSGLTKFACEMLQFEYDDVDEDDDQVVPGTSDEVLRFVEEISERPYFWTDFPVALDNEDFSMTHNQRRHALAIEELVPELLTLRLDLCSHMNVETFWFIYFLLLLPRLNQQDSQLLSTAKIVEVRSMILKNLEDKKTTLEDDNPKNLRNPSPHRQNGNESFTERDNISSDENLILDDEIISATECLGIDDDTQSCSAKWYEDTDFSHTLAQFKQEEEDVSFNDLEDDDNKSVISDSGESRDLTRVESRDGFSGWVKL